MKNVTLIKIRSLVLMTSLLLPLSGCDHQPEVQAKQTNTYSSEVAIKWLNMQVKQMREYPPTIGNVLYSRHYAYSGIALYEAVVPGMPAYQSIASQLNGLTGLPIIFAGVDYHWPASANAALAAINRAMFPNATDANKALINQLETDLQNNYAKDVDVATLERSVTFGKAIADAVLQWAETDGYKLVNGAYTPPAASSGGKYWTPPSPLPVHSLPYFGNLRPLVSGSGTGADPGPPNYDKLAEMTTEVINAKPATSTDEYNTAFWWRDFPGTSTPGHYVSILKQVLQKKQSGLDVAALAYALGGITVMDITISTWQAKYKYLLARPFDYDDVMGQPFTALLGAPHPEYPAAHASLSLANAEAMTTVLGDNQAFTDSTFNGLVTPQGITLGPRSYDSFREAGEEAGWSRLYGGIHYRKSIEVGFWQGKKVADNIKNTLKFLR
ncbi:vanadium-dependent haloperoxidase [Larkinella humicola]|uniref:Vanadium-dependent haloperoxidase n=1 Tax=Larkinella humicola TaxID=2607654 RepID=A0A5N1J1Q5_9BACT|nr:vanadium-dependent haloperoxidase [Larkinella humicola]KAA9340354.1 vanadium-dependent haloperoxidase [Larkinella humicola]